MNGVHGCFRFLSGILTVCLLLAITPVAGETGIVTPALPETKDKPVKAVPVYRPPPRGSPAVRVGGATRTAGAPLPALQVLAPDHIGLTVQPRPVFQWYLSRPATVRFEFALIDDESIEPVLELDFGTVHSRGIQQLDLVDTGVVLEPGIPYQWSVAIIPNEQTRSGDVVASGMIERIAMPDGLAARLRGASEYEQVIAYAGAGIWYDALAILSKLIAADPANIVLRKQRASLLEQVGLPVVGLAEETVK